MNPFHRFIRLPQEIPAQYRSNFAHLAADLGWYGVLNGSTLAFLAIYATRLGATGTEIGLLNAVPAIISLIFALPSSRWLERRPAGQSVFWTSIYSRVFYLLLIPLPFLFMPRGEIWAIILITLFMTIPSIANTVGFFNLFAEAVPIEWRGYVAGLRNAIFSIVTIITSLLCGEILVTVRFPVGYQVVFGLGVLGAAMSSYHLWRLRHITSKTVVPLTKTTPSNPDEEIKSSTSDQLEIKPNYKLLPSNRLPEKLSLGRLDIIKGPFGKVVLLLFGFHLAQYLGIPIFPLYTVNQVHFSDQVLSIGVGVFNTMVFFGSMQLAWLTPRLGNRRILGFGILIVSFYPMLMAVTTNAWVYVITSIIGGTGWSLVNGALYNYLLEKVPKGPRPAYLAWYNVGLNAAILIGSLTGPALAHQFGFVTALLICAAGRLLSGAAILRWGE
jgi:MFS family permease